MKLVTRVALLLVMCVVLLAAVQKGNNADKAKCLATCKAKCAKSYTTCVNSAKSDAARKSCERSKQICDSDCVNKACQ